LYYYRARYYSPRLQRFISEDPIGFLGGDANVYAYVGEDPVSRRDPSGLHLGSVVACSVVNAMKQLSDFSSDLYALNESTRMTRDMLDRVKSEISQCPSKDTERLGKLRNIQDQLNRQLTKSLRNFTADATKSGLYQVAEGLAWEGACAATWFLPW
jgi:uncharacterized protein RhaS with RHS repeats